jgi:hypothetical protein
MKAQVLPLPLVPATWVSLSISLACPLSYVSVVGYIDAQNVRAVVATISFQQY